MRFISLPKWSAALSVLLMAMSAQGAQTLSLKQRINNQPAELMSTAELSNLADPFFNIVLKNKADVVSLSGIENLIQPDASKRKVFVVSESLADPTPGQSRRSVIAFTGTNPVTNDVLDGNIMISVFFNSETFPDQPSAIEVLGWDNHQGRYNYYKMDRSGTPDGRFSWKFRGSSDDVDLLLPAERVGTCMQCHINGGVVMKELGLPWGNWVSDRFPASYLKNDWRVKNNSRIKEQLEGAASLEVQFILGAVKQFNTSRINSQIVKSESHGNILVDADGNSRIVDSHRVIRHLFETTEVNFISDKRQSGMHPFDPNQTGQPVASTKVPNTLMINSNLIAGSGITDYKGLGIFSSQNFSNALVVQPAEYKMLIDQSGVRLNGVPGDAAFTWFVPEPSHMDNSAVDRLMAKGILSKHFVASVLAIDLETPIFSKERTSLLRFVPRAFKFRLDGSVDHLTPIVIANIKEKSPAAGSVEAEFLSLLENTDPVKELERRVDSYLQRVKDALQADRAAELMRIQNKAIAIRKAFKQHPVLHALDETQTRLLPLPSLP